MTPRYYPGMPAIYSPRDCSSDIPNPYYEALPPALSIEETLSALSDPSSFYHPSWRELPYAIREARLALMQEFFFVPRRCHAQLVCDIRSTLYCAYSSWGSVYGPNCFAGKLDNFLDVIHRQNLYSRNLGLFGDSGSGKSLAVVQAINQFPTIIRHSEYGGQDFISTQAPIVVVICPKSGDLALCRAILRSISQYLKSPFKNPKSAEEGMAMIAAKVRSGGIGLIVLDEYDSIFRGTKIDDTLQLLTNLNEDAGIPFLKIGTRFAFTRMKNVTHSARRASGHAPWRRMEKNEEWEKWFEEVLKFQLVDVPIAYTSEMSGIFYDYSQGLAEAAIGLLVTVQKRALQDGSKEVLQKHFKGVDEAEMYIMAPTLRKYRRLAAAQKAAAAQAALKSAPPAKPQDPAMDVDKITGTAASPSPDSPTTQEPGTAT